MVNLVTIARFIPDWVTLIGMASSSLKTENQNLIPLDNKKSRIVKIRAFADIDL